jgi:REP element-mobilizing transposase RayT
MMQELKRSAAISAAGPEACRLRFGAVKIRDRGRLPHWETDAGLYFITFRLADSLPKQLLIQLEQQLGHSETRQMSRAEMQDLRERRARLIEAYLDRGAGKCYLAQPRVAEIVASALTFAENRDYRLLGWCIMPNHVHVVPKLLPDRNLSKIIHSWKSYTAKEANRILNRRGSFWQREYYDRLIRTDGELDRMLKYIAHNPMKAGLRNWRWVKVRGHDALEPAGEDAGATT